MKKVIDRRFRRVILWIVLLWIVPLIVIQLAGASPGIQEDPIQPCDHFPGLSEPGTPIIPVLIEQSSDSESLELNTFAAPEISVWYGLNQSFGQNGNPQKKIDILGRINIPENNVEYLTYRLNNGPVKNLSIGSDKRRLYGEGDFIVEVSLIDPNLKSGANKIVIELKSKFVPDPVSVEVSLNFNPSNSWPRNYTADWSSSNNIQDIAQVVNGQWVISDNKLKQVDGATGYDRLVVLGEYDEWDDFEATVPLVIKGINPDGFKKPSGGAGVGVIARWQGYGQENGEQPALDWRNIGALAWNSYVRDEHGHVSQGLVMIGYSGNTGNINRLAENRLVQLQFNVPYFYKISVKSVDDDGDIYRFKVWPQSETEPYRWDIVAQGDPDEPKTGSLSLIAHHVDVEFGNVEVTRVTDEAKYTLNLGKQGSGDDPVVFPDGPYSYGQVVTLTANSATDVLGRWEGDAGGRQNPRQFIITGNADVSAVYVPYATGVLDKSVSGGSGEVTVYPNKGEYLIGEEVTVVAKPDPEYDFVKWKTSNSMSRQAASDSTDNPYTFIFGVDATSVTAQFTGKKTYNLTTNTVGTGSGSILTDPEGSSFYEGTVVEVTGQSAAGSKFSGWNVPYEGQSNPFFILMDEPRSVSADFEQVANTYKLTIAPPPQNGKIMVEPEKAEYLYGELVTLTAVGDPGYMLGNWQGDLSGNTNPLKLAMFDDYTVSADFVEEINPISDDFNRCVLDNGQWTVIDPLGDGTFNMTGTKLEVSVPAGHVHNIYGDVNNAPRVLTPADNEDIQLEVKFDSALTENNQDMGILVQEDEDKLLRLDFFYDGTKTHIFGAAVESSSTTNMFNIEIANGSPAPLYMLVKRDGNEWTVSYKYANDTWVKAKTFTHNMTVNEVGLYVANPGTAPAFKGQFDYFFNAVNPIIPQDQNKNTISVSTVGEGTVEYDKKDNYACGEKVTFEAIPAEGWNFGGWGGSALSGYSNPDTLTVSGSHEVIAKFTTGSGGISIYMPAVIKP